MIKKYENICLEKFLRCVGCRQMNWNCMKFFLFFTSSCQLTPMTVIKICSDFFPHSIYWKRKTCWFCCLKMFLSVEYSFFLHFGLDKIVIYKFLSIIEISILNFLHFTEPFQYAFLKKFLTTSKWMYCQKSSDVTNR